MDYQTLRLELDAGIARVVLSRPEAGNEIDVRMLSELEHACATVADRDDVIVVVVEATGADFCRGWDDAARDEIAARRATGMPAVADRLAPVAALVCPVVAALQGQVCSGGLELALACDIRIGADDARFSLPDVTQGRLPLAGGTQRLPRVIGRARALAMLLAGEELDAASAYRAGLISRVAPRDQLLADADALARQIATRGPIALRYAKEAVRRGLELTLEQGMRYETDLSVILQTTSDRAEGVRAFFEKRPPRFRGT